MSVVSNTSLEFTLREGANALGLDLSEAQITQLLDFLALLQKWNKVYNLTAVRDPQEMLTHHLLDSLAAVPPLRRHVAQRGQDSAARPGARLLDVGSGGGLPGVVFAICCPEVDVSCVDTVAKKAAFIQQAAGTLGLSNLRGIHARVETLAGPFDVVSCRAFAALADFTAWSRQALAPHGVWLAMKGKHPHDEIAALPADVSVFHVEQLTVPGLQAERCILWLRPVA
ncbi:16S rRNA (guanine(527)-N(7))-methyltransferase RsmG [Diaphorobacter sp. J5-51]|uniref:16S rRNA (guanine(527)-N(7))-methyltransferase RsmG n=1 Tax=Diaphorobacter sp. J5-51 TaxID=680496 RepID=UPI00064303B9|nr:16S rRNA (guanine(527)-N(7))-methyltransferase RsmG [Diaphorobacter sp. J5-51]KLR57335.1 16S rRNA methyltransferase [Diaphorobacter sp. J5-51]